MATIALPGLIDPHVHLRDLGQEEKEDFYTGTAAALSGGYTTVLDMPNNKTPITTAERLNEKIAIAGQKIVCDVGFYFGSQGDPLQEFAKVQDKVFGLKLYLNETTGNFLIDKVKLKSIFIAWEEATYTPALHSNRLQRNPPILVHAQGRMIEGVIATVEQTRQKTHFCHISTKADLVLILRAKENRLPVTCGVTPHHLFLTEDDEKSLGSFGKMKPPLATRGDVDFLWKNLQVIDVIESDHAPHTKEEKGSNTPPYGVPGLETTLPLLLTSVSEGKLQIDDVVRLCYKNPAKIFGLPTDETTKVEVDLAASYAIDNKSLFTKCGWSPFHGWRVKGEVQRVFLRGQKIFENKQVLVNPGSGNII